jgi:hypothetical protein
MRGLRVPASETTPDKLITSHAGTSEDTLDNALLLPTHGPVTFPVIRLC